MYQLINTNHRDVLQYLCSAAVQCQKSLRIWMADTDGMLLVASQFNQFLYLPADGLFFAGRYRGKYAAALSVPFSPGHAPFPCWQMW